MLNICIINKNKGEQMRALILYDSFTGNTEKIVQRINRVLANKEVTVEQFKITKDFNKTIDVLDFDLVFLGSPVIQFLPSVNIINFCKKHLMDNLKKGMIIPKSPKIEGKYAVPFVSFGGMHTGIREAIPALKYLQQYLEHLRFEIIEEFYIVGEYRSPEFSKFNKETALGDITGRPDSNDLDYVEHKVGQILKKIELKKRRNTDIHVPDILNFIENNYPDLKEPLFSFINKNNEIKTLTERETVLIMIALSCFAKCRECLKHHITNALSIGVTEEEIKDIFIGGFLAAGASFVNFGVEILKELGIE